jgi:hypothetical protein
MLSFSENLCLNIKCWDVHVKKHIPIVLIFCNVFRTMSAFVPVSRGYPQCCTLLLCKFAAQNLLCFGLSKNDKISQEYKK